MRQRWPQLLGGGCRNHGKELQQEIQRIFDPRLSGETLCLLMDTIEIAARNLFYRAVAPFKVADNNYRDNHDCFRELRQSSGVLRWTGAEIEVHPVPTVNYAPKLRKIIDRPLQDLNASDLKLPDSGSGSVRRAGGTGLANDLAAEKAAPFGTGIEGKKLIITGTDRGLAQRTARVPRWRRIAATSASRSSGLAKNSAAK